MHEMGIALQIVEIAESAIPAEMKGARVERISLKVGKMAGIVPEYLNFCMEAAAKDTPLEGAALDIDEVPVMAGCRDCRHQWKTDGAVFTCPVCGSSSLEIISGRELDVVSLDIGDDTGE